MNDYLGILYQQGYRKKNDREWVHPVSGILSGAMGSVLSLLDLREPTYISGNINSPLDAAKEKIPLSADRWEWNGENYPNIKTSSKTPIMDEVRKHKTLSPEQLSKLLSEVNSKKI